MAALKRLIVRHLASGISVGVKEDAAAAAGLSCLSVGAGRFSAASNQKKRWESNRSVRQRSHITAELALCLQPPAGKLVIGALHERSMRLLFFFFLNEYMFVYSFVLVLTL